MEIVAMLVGVKVALLLAYQPSNSVVHNGTNRKESSGFHLFIFASGLGLSLVFLLTSLVLIRLVFGIGKGPLPLG